MSVHLPTTGVLGGLAGHTTSGILAVSAGVDVVALDVDSVGDDGGWKVTATGTFPVDQPVLFRLQDGVALDELCYSGVPGSGAWVQSTDGVTAAFVVPTAPIGGPYDVYCESEDGAFSDTLPAALEVVHRTFTTDLYGVRAALPPPRDVGPYDIAEEA